MKTTQIKGDSVWSIQNRMAMVCHSLRWRTITGYIRSVIAPEAFEPLVDDLVDKGGQFRWNRLQTWGWLR